VRGCGARRSTSRWRSARDRCGPILERPTPRRRAARPGRRSGASQRLFTPSVKRVPLGGALCANFST
jgi:hypothetical protein